MMKGDRKNRIVIIVICFSMIAVAFLFHFGIQDNSKVYQYIFTKAPYEEILNIFEDKEVYKFRDNSGWLEVKGIDINYENKTASIEGTPIAVERITYAEALERSGFTEPELFDLVNKLKILGFTRVELIASQIAPEQITLYGFCRNDECYDGIIYSSNTESLDSVSEVLERISELEIESTSSPNIFIFRSNKAYWL